MKKYFALTTIILLFLFVQCTIKDHSQKTNQPNTFTLTAHIEGLTSDTLYYYEKDDSYPNGYRYDTIQVSDESFTFTDSVEDYKIYFIGVPEALRSWTEIYNGKEYRSSVKALLSRIWFIGYPGAKIHFDGKVEEFMVTGNYTDQKNINPDLGEIYSKTFPIENRIDSLYSTVRGIELDEEARERYNEKRFELWQQVIKLKYDFIESHPQSIAASYVFSDCYYRRYFTAEENELLFNNFDSDALTGTPFYDEVKSRMEAMKMTGIGMQAPDIATTLTMDGSEFKLSSLRGNYVLIDYWGSWCGPCMGEIPKIKEYYNKYSDKNFKVLGVNSGDTDARWKATVEEGGFNWEHVRTTKENDLLVPFNVNSFPTKILIDPNGKIIYSSKNTEEKVDLYKMLDDIFLEK